MTALSLAAPALLAALPGVAARTPARSGLARSDAVDLVVATTVAARGSVRPHPVIAALNAMRSDAAAVGHEFNSGLGLGHRA